MKLLALAVIGMAASVQAFHYGPPPFGPPGPYGPPGLLGPPTFESHHYGLEPVRHIVNHRPIPIDHPVPVPVVKPVPIFKDVFNTVVQRVPTPVRVAKPVPVAHPVDVVKPFNIYKPVDVLKKVPIENHHFHLRKVGIPVY